VGTSDADTLLDGLGLVGPALPVLIDGDGNFTGATVESVARARNFRNGPGRDRTCDLGIKSGCSRDRVLSHELATPHR
jgi:hypothetical protein